MLVHWIWLAMLPGLNGRQKLELLRSGSPEDLYALDRKAKLSENVLQHLLNKDLEPAKRIMRNCAEKGIGILVFTDSAYPNRLRRIDAPPLVIYYRGSIPALDLQPVVGIVGTRNASPYGLRSAGKMGAQIAACGGIVASGGAFGIDSVALRGALETGGSTVAVMAGGLDKLYPAANEPLFKRIMENGCIFSEFPPGAPAFRGNFLWRNRLISGISNALLVVEAPKVSGALNTARWASEQGKDVFAVPGNIDVPNCEGSNALIGDIARPALDGWSVLKDYIYDYPDVVKQVKLELQPHQLENLAEGAEKPKSQEKADKKIVDKKPDCSYSVKQTPAPALSPQEQAVAALLTKEPVPVDQLLDQLDMAPAEVLNIVTRLSLKGVAQTHPGKFVSAKSGG